MRNVHQKVNLSIVVVLLKRTKISFHPCCFNSLVCTYILRKKEKSFIQFISLFSKKKRKVKVKKKRGMRYFHPKFTIILEQGTGLHEKGIIYILSVLGIPMV